MNNMNYYNPNYYQNYPYNGNSQYSAYPPPTPLQMPQQQPQNIQGLNGKMVDSVDMVRVTEVPIGGYGIFPKADLSEIYIKSWNPNGTTSISTFKPFITPVEETPQAIEMNTVLERINSLEGKIDAALGQMIAVPQVKEDKPATAARKEF